MDRTALALAVGVSWLLCAPAARGQVVIATVSVGDAGNPSDVTGFGTVAHEYRIGRVEVTNTEYAAFLNAVAARGDPYALYNTSMEQHSRGGITRSGEGTESAPFQYTPKKEAENDPVNFVSFYDAVRFVNWLENGQGTSDTESGTYHILNGGLDAGEVGERTPGARRFLPNENEWYKAAYYDPARGRRGGYWLFPTRSDTPITPVVSDGAAAAGVPAHAILQDPPPAPDTGVVDATGTYIPSFYRTFNQDGRVREWNESPAEAGRSIRGGSWRCYVCARSFDSASALPGHQDAQTGFRVACRAPYRLDETSYRGLADPHSWRPGPVAPGWASPTGLGGGLLGGGGGGGGGSSVPWTSSTGDRSIPGLDDETTLLDEPVPDAFEPTPQDDLQIPNPLPTDQPPSDVPEEEIPEPSALWFLLFGGAFLLKRR